MANNDLITDWQKAYEEGYFDGADTIINSSIVECIHPSVREAYWEGYNQRRGEMRRSMSAHEAATEWRQRADVNIPGALKGPNPF